MNEKQRFVVIVTLVLAALIGLGTAASAESVYLPFVKNNHIEVIAEYTACGSPAAGISVSIDFVDTEPPISIYVPYDGVVRIAGINNSSLVRISGIKGQMYWFIAKTQTEVSFAMDCDGHETIIPSPVAQ